MKKEYKQLIENFHKDISDYSVEALEYLRLPLEERDEDKAAEIRQKLLSIDIFTHNLTDQELTLWLLRDHGLKFDEIGKEMKMTKKEAMDMYKLIKEKIKQ